MLHRSFKPAKCKTSLKLASARLKLLKNRKDVQVKQLKKELAQLLESGQEQTARIRVENVIHEVKLVAAYDLLEIYCELIAARLQIIESQKNCPIDMKEAITSVIFASPRCSDVTELQDIRKQFTAKYSKEFVTAAVELRPDCGVSRLLVEKLSANATDGQAKLKFLKEIADEHGVKWEPVLLDPKPSQDLLKGPTSFVKAEIKTEPPPPPTPTPPVQTATPPTFQSHYSMNAGSNNNNANERFNHEHVKTSFKHPYSVHEEVFSPSMKNRNMEFENAAAAAMAAAESADIACRAAREAAEFASQGKFSRQPSTDSHKSRLSDSQNDEDRRRDDRNSENLSFQRRNSLLKNDSRIHRGPSRSDSLKSKASSIDDRYQNDFHNAERYSPKNSFFSEQNLEKQSSSSRSENFDYYDEERLTRKISLNKTSAVFDDSGSDVDYDYEFDVERKDDSPKPERTSSSKSYHDVTPPERTYSSKSYHDVTPPERSYSSKSYHDVTPPVTFDDSEGDETDNNSRYNPPTSIRVDSSSDNDDDKIELEEPTSEKRLNFENLRGGFKHYKSRIPPYTSPTAKIDNVKPSIQRDDPVTASDSDSGEDFNAVILPKRESSFKQVNKTPPPTRLQPKTTYFDSDESETEEHPSSSQVSGSGQNNRVETTPLFWRTKTRMVEERPTVNDPKPVQKQKLMSFQHRTEVELEPPEQPPYKKEQLRMSSSSSAMETRSSENSFKTSTSHVHPNLPDYDEIAARMQALRVNRR
ncbi:uncharacterized protein LOC124937472 [Impatiens glandulifera]|uniref:uncharacterized protein LOC124937472 n=1 Tax=Impatiens glandulifera TaxID=253017 RepID=UPI001FB114A4|nr:uncharacterized protein LOC124937472 [Impatiens glandulifera]